jgi:anti-anti-sigma factor
MNKVINIDIENNVVVIATEGYLNKDLGEEIQNLAQEHIKDGKRMFLINLKASNIVNSIGASIMIELIEQLQEIDGQLAFCDLAPIIEKTFKIMGLTKYCEVYPTQEDALSQLA